MALTLRDASTGLQFRDSAFTPRQSGLFADQLEASDTNPVTRGWNAADIGIEASDLMAQANAAERAGDPLLSQSLQQRAKDQMARAQAWAPTTQSFRDIDSAGSAADWLGGAVGGIRSSVGPLVGGAAGALAGTAVGLATRNPQLGMRAAQFLSPAGAFVPGYDLMYDESITQSMMDPAVRARSTPEEMHRAAQGVGLVGGALESIVPAGVGRMAVQGLGKQGIGKVVAREAGEEFLTEGAQTLVGQTAQNQLRGDPLTQYDWGEVLDSAAAGAVGGGVMSGGGAAIGAARDKLVGGTQTVAGAVGDVARDPTGVVIDAMKRHAEKSGRKQAQDEIAGMSDEDVLARVMGRKAPSVTDDLRADERDLDDKSLDTKRAEEARADAEQVLRSHPREHAAEERQAAADFISGRTTWDKYREVRRGSSTDRKAQQEADELFSAMGLTDEKHSLMSPTLTDDFGEQEGRDMDADTVVDDQGNVVAGTQNPLGEGADPRTNSGYKGDKFGWPRGRGYSVFKKTDHSESDFNYDSIQRSAGIQAAQNAEDTMLPADERGFGSAVRRVAALQKKYNAKATKEDAQRTVSVADVLLKNNYFPKEVVETAKTAAQKDALLSSTAALVSWMKYGMQGDANQLHVLAKYYGDKILPVLDAAYEAGVNAGVVPRNPERFAEVSKALTQEHASLKLLGDMLISKINPAYAAELKSMSKKQLANTVNEVMRLVTTEGDRANAALREMFPDDQNRAEVTEAFYNVSMARNAYGTESRASQPVRDEGDGTSRAEKSFEVDERNDMSQKEDEFEGQVTGQKVEYLSRARGHAFNRKDPEHRAALSQARADALRRESNVANPARVEEVGAIDRALERAEKAKGDKLTDEERFRAIEKEVKKHTRKGLDRPAEPPANASDVAKRMYQQDYARYQKRIRAAAPGVNKRYVFLKRTETAAGELDSAVDLEAILANERDVKLDDPRNGVENGTMWFEKATGGKFIINAPQITRLMFQRKGKDGDPGLNHEVGSGEEKGPLYKGGPQNVLEMFHEGVGSILEHDYFTGKFGYVRGGEAVELSDTVKTLKPGVGVTAKNEGATGLTQTFATHLPKNFKLSSKVTYGDGVASAKEFGNKIEGNDYDPEEIGTPTRKIAATVYEKIFALEAFLKAAKKGEQRNPAVDFAELALKNFDGRSQLDPKNENGARRTADVAKAHRDLKAAVDGLIANIFSAADDKIDPAEIRKLDAFMKHVWEQHRAGKAKQLSADERFSRNTHILLGKWMVAAGLNPGDISRGEWQLQKDRAQDGLQAYDPEALIVRDEKGLAQTDNTEMVAASHVGRSMRGTKPVAERKVGDKIVDEPITENVEGQPGVATKELTPDEQAAQLRTGAIHQKSRVTPQLTDKIKYLFENTALKVRGLTKDEVSFVSASLTELSARSAAFGDFAAQIGSFYAFGVKRKITDDMGNTVEVGGSEHSGLYQGDLGEGLGGVVGLNINVFTDLRNHLFQNLGHQVRYILAHEIGHAADIGPNKSDRGVYSSDKAFEMAEDGAVGPLALEMYEAANDKANPFSALLNHTPFKKEYDGRPQAAQRELFAQAFAMYAERKAEMKKHLPQTYAHMENIYGETENSIQRSPEADTGAREPAGVANSSAQEGNNPGTSRRSRVQRAKGRPVRNEPIDAERARLTALQAKRAGWMVSKIKTREGMAELEAAIGRADREKLLGLDTALKEAFPVNEASSFWAKHGLPDEQYYAALENRVELMRRKEQRYAALEKRVELMRRKVLEELAKTDAAAYDSARKKPSDIEADRAAFEGDGETKASEQTTSNQEPLNADEAVAYLKQVFGKDFDAEVVADLGGKAGVWTPHGIKLAAAAPNGVQYHEALHEFFAQLSKHGADNVRDLIQRVATNPIIMRKLEQLLEGHPKARKQLRKPEEAAAYLFQFWNMGLIDVGPETKSLFQTIKDLIARALKTMHGLVNASVREQNIKDKAVRLDQEQARRAFEALNGGNFADPEARQAAYDALRKNAEAHAKAVEEIGLRGEKFWQGLGRYVVTSESMLNLYSQHPELKTIADKFHQMAGKGMKNQARDNTLDARGGFIEATHRETQTRLNRFERFLQDGKYDEKDIELAMPHLERGSTNSADPKIAKLVTFAREYMAEMYDYMVQSDVRRLDPKSEERWVPIQKRKDYFTQSWSIEALTKDHDGFVKTLLERHAKELGHMAQQANAELAAWQKDQKTKLQSPSAKVEVDRAWEEFKESGQIIGKLSLQTVTPELIAEQIYTRLLNSTGLVDVQESEWSLGLTPAAAAVNRRELDWLDKDAFSKYKSKDLVEIMTNYTRTMVKRAEYQKRFGYGGEVIADAMDTATLRELGGQELVEQAQRSLPMAVKAWKKAAQEWHADNGDTPYPEPYPTLRMVGIDAHRSLNGAEKTNEALVKAEKALRPAVNAVRAMEGTLGNEINQSLRSVNSWINTYQNVRLLPLALFTNFSDVIGLTVQGGTLGDAWDAFVSGIREVRNTWVNEKGTDSRTLRAEQWGVSDAGALLDTLGQNYSSVYMSEKARKVNNTFFRVIGMEGWNRGVRITAAALGERVIGDWAKNGVDSKKPGEAKRFERLYGKGADPKRIKLDADGNLDINDAANRAAIQRFVQDAVMSSNSAVRTAWMSDPRFATFAHLKNFAYAFHSVMLKGILGQAVEGNFRPALVAGLGFTSIAIAGAAVKEMLIPGEEPPWMQGGLDGYLDYGLGQANLGGVPQLWTDGLRQLDPAKMAGPFWDQIQNTISSPIPGISVNLSPFDGETELLRDRKVAVELTKALPAGNIMGRYMDAALAD